MRTVAPHFFDVQKNRHATTASALQEIPRIENDVSYEVSHLERMVNDGLKNLQTACAQMREVEEDLQRFLKDYYAQVGYFFEQLEALRREIAEYDRKIAEAVRKGKRLNPPADDRLLLALREELPDVPQRLVAHDWEDEMKGIYHRLVKLYHPDVQPDSRYSTQVLQLINRAYEKQNIWAMREMEHSLVEHALARRDTPESKMTRLRERFEAIAGSVARATKRKSWLESSEAWLLKERMEQDRYLVEVIIHRAKQQIADAKRLLARRKIEYKAVVI